MSIVFAIVRSEHADPQGELMIIDFLLKLFLPQVTILLGYEGFSKHCSYLSFLVSVVSVSVSLRIRSMVASHSLPSFFSTS